MPVGRSRPIWGEQMLFDTKGGDSFHTGNVRTKEKVREKRAEGALQGFQPVVQEPLRLLSTDV